MRNVLAATYIGALGAVGVAACCVLPVTMMLLGLGGSWLAIFGKIAAVGPYALGLSTLLLVGSLGVSLRRRSLFRLRWWHAGTVLATGTAWAVFLNQNFINDTLIGWM